MLSSNAKISIKKEHNSIRAVSLQIFIIVRLTIFFYRENKVLASLYTTVKINTAIMQYFLDSSKAKVFLSDYADVCYTHVSRVFRRLDMLLVSRFQNFSCPGSDDGSSSNKTRPAEAVRPLRPWSDQNFCHLRSKSYIFKILVGPIIVWSRFSQVVGPILDSFRHPCKSGRWNVSSVLSLYS